MKRLINLEATSCCYADCSMCPRDKVKVKGFISLETVDKVIEKVKDYDLFEISISGRGEPTLHPELVTIINKLKVLKIPISVVTTSAGMNESNYKSIVDAVDILRLSISSIDEDCFKQVHCGLDYANTWNVIEKIVNYVPQKIHVHLVGGDSTYAGLEKTIQYFKAHNIDNIYLFPLWNRGGNIENRDILTLRKRLVEEYSIFYSEDEYMDDEKIKQLHLTNYCPVGDTSVSINHLGEMMGCFQDFENNNVVCTVFEEEDFLSKRCTMLRRMNICQECNMAGQVRR